MKEKQTNLLSQNICPVCGQYVFEEMYDICEVCFWEDDPIQCDKPDYSGGANNLSLNEYKKRWTLLEKIMPELIEKYNIVRAESASWKYDRLIVPRDNITPFVNELNGYGIAVQASFYNVCEQYGYDSLKFHGYPYVGGCSPRDENDETLNIIFSKDPVKTCEKYNLIQLSEILNNSENITETWEKLTPYICIEPNTKWKV